MSGQRAKVLVVDDDVAVRNVVRDALRAGDFEVLLADSGEEAMAVSDRTKPDLVILDLGMPGMSGEQLLDVLHERWPGLPVVVLSGLAQPEDTPDLIARGARAVVGKPFGARDFLKLIDATLE